MNNIGQRIKELRIKKGFSQEELGKLVGVQKAAIYKYENGLVVNLKQTTINNLAKALNTSPAYLMGWDDEDNQTQQDDSDVAIAIDDLLQKLELEQEALMFHGKAISDETKELLIASLERTYRLAKKMEAEENKDK